MAEIYLKQLAHSYLPHPQAPSDYALKQIDLTWEDGKAYALLGSSGCGKSTLLNIISGLLHPSQGQVLFDGQDVTQLPTEQRQIAQVFQFPVVYDTMTVYDNLAFPLRNRKVDEATIKTRVQEIAQLLEMSGDLKKKAQGLTADAKQKISLGRGLIRQDVAAILFDEPLTVIDPHLKWLLRMQLKALHQKSQRTMIYVTHDQTEALTFADQVVVMYDGYVVQMGTPQALFERPAHTFVGYFIGSPGMNVLPVQVAGRQVSFHDQTLYLPQSYTPAPNTSLALGIRPEFLSLHREPTFNSIPVTIQRIEDIGRHKIVRTAFQDLIINVIVPDQVAVSPEYTYLSFDAAHIHLYANDWLITAEDTL
ncbi:ABC transporter ATP-binding protein [Thiofilum flexile]|uniref:ABC transporter ATP-binding protein n=1 Tax=Thiofilum flexile TaxID=125627 RepID=UPI00037E052C|nr:ABC transporter ATP-binding protein [Thiofilum flexile]